VRDYDDEQRDVDTGCGCALLFSALVTWVLEYA
jgi:hypothetical protein